MHKIILLLLSTLTSGESINNDAFLSSLIGYFNINHIIGIRSDKELIKDYIDMHKSFAGNDKPLYTSVLSYTDLISALENGEIDGFRSLLVVDSDNSDFGMSQLFEISNKIDISPFTWVLKTRKSDEKDYEGIRIPFGCEFVIAEGADKSGYTLTEIYDMGSNPKLSIYLGKWSPGNGLEATDMSLLKRRSNFREAQFNVSANHQDPCSIISFESVAGSILKCLHYHAFIMISKMNNFSLHLVAKERAGGFDPSDLDPEFQLTLFEVSYIPPGNFTVSWPTLKIPMDIFTAYEGHGLNWSTFIQPFTKQMWTAVIIWLFFSAGVIALAEFIILNIKRRRKKNLILKLWINYIFFNFSAICSQNPERETDRLSIKIMLYAIFLIPTALIPGYSGALTSFLAVKFEKMPFTNLEGLSEAKDYRLGYQSTFNLSLHFDLNKGNQILEDLFRDIIVPPEELPEFETEGLQKMCREKYSYLCAEQAVRALKPPCRYYKLEEPFIYDFVHFPYKSDSPYNPYIDRSLRRVLFTGIFVREASEIVSDSILYPIVDKDVVLEPVKFENIVGIIVLFGLSALFSLILLFGEIIFFKNTTAKINKTSIMFHIGSSY